MLKTINDLNPILALDIELSDFENEKTDLVLERFFDQTCSVAEVIDAIEVIKTSAYGVLILGQKIVDRYKNNHELDLIYLDQLKAYYDEQPEQLRDNYTTSGFMQSLVTDRAFSDNVENQKFLVEFIEKNKDTDFLKEQKYDKSKLVLNRKHFKNEYGQTLKYYLKNF